MTRHLFAVGKTTEVIMYDGIGRFTVSEEQLIEMGFTVCPECGNWCEPVSPEDWCVDCERADLRQVLTRDVPDLTAEQVKRVAEVVIQRDYEATPKPGRVS